MEILIRTNGSIICRYTESLDLAKLGKQEITRASYVEPSPKGNWYASLQPLNGPVLGPFKLRSEALAAESQWIDEHLQELNS